MRQAASGAEAQGGEAQADGGGEAARRAAKLSFAERYDSAAAHLLELLAEGCAAEREWPRGVSAATRSALAYLAADPELAELLVLGPYAAGDEAQLRHEETLARLVALLRRGREATECEPLPEGLEEGLVGAAAFIVSRPLRAEEPDLLPALGPELIALLLTPYLGRDEAEQIAFFPDDPAAEA